MKSEKSDLVSHSKAEIVQNSSLSFFFLLFFLFFFFSFGLLFLFCCCCCVCCCFFEGGGLGAELYRRTRNILWSAKMMETTTCANSDEYMAWLSQK